MSKEKQMCFWCTKESDLDSMIIPSTPILEWMEQKLIDIDKDFTGTASTHLTPDEQDEISLYDYMINRMIKGTVCSSCWGKEQILWETYYTTDPEDQYDDDDDDE